MRFYRKIITYYRINDWYYYLGFVLLGYVVRFHGLDLSLVWPITSVSLALAYAFSFNDFYDGRLRKKVFLIPLLALFPTLIFLNWVQATILFLFILIFTFYSYPFTRLKGKPILSTFSNSISFSMLFLIGASTLTFTIFFFFLIFLCFNTTAQLIHEIVDYREDKKKGDVTTTVRYGTKVSRKVFTFSLISVAIFSAILFYLEIVRIFFLISTLLFVAYFLLEVQKLSIDKNFRKRYKCLGIILGIIYFFLFLKF